MFASSKSQLTEIQLFSENIPESTKMSINMTAALLDDLDAAESLFRRACEQVLILNKEVENLTSRYSESEKRGNKALCYQLRLRISVLEGVRNMFYEYAAQKANVITELQRHILADDDSDNMSNNSSFSELATDAVDADDSLEFC